MNRLLPAGLKSPRTLMILLVLGGLLVWLISSVQAAFGAEPSAHAGKKAEYEYE